jgi:tRNA threonylcarbamoyladenosine biosynthesis protein TsaB
MLLAIDTATQYMCLALHDGNAVIAEQLWRTGNKHNLLLAQSIQAMLTVCDVKLDDLTAFAVSTGPGSYTGLRIGVALAKGMAAVRHLPLVGVSSLDTVAAGHPYQNTRYHLVIAVQAGRGRIVAGLYRAKKGRWVAYNEPTITTWDDLLKSLNEESSYYITGEVDDTGRSSIAAAKARGSSLTLVNAGHRARRAGFLAQEALRRLEAGSPEDFTPDKVVPVYIKTDSIP